MASVPFPRETVTLRRCLSGWGSILQRYAQDYTVHINVLELHSAATLCLLTHQGNIKSAQLLQVLQDHLMLAPPLPDQPVAT